MSGQSLFLKSTENDGRNAQLDQLLAARGAGRLIFALDATASSEPRADVGHGAQVDRHMIREAASVESRFPRHGDQLPYRLTRRGEVGLDHLERAGVLNPAGHRS